MTQSGSDPKTQSTSKQIPEIAVVLFTLVALTAIFYAIRFMTPGPGSSSQQPSQQSTAQNPSSGSTMPRDQLILPSSYDSLLATGHQMMDQQNFLVASEAYARALALDSSNVDIIVDYGACLHGIGMPDRALQEFRRALKRAPNHPIAHFNMGIVHMPTSPDSARFYWNRYLEIEPNGPGADRARELLANHPTK